MLRMPHTPMGGIYASLLCCFLLHSQRHFHLCCARSVVAKSQTAMSQTATEGRHGGMPPRAAHEKWTLLSCCLVVDDRQHVTVRLFWSQGTASLRLYCLLEACHRLRVKSEIGRCEFLVAVGPRWPRRRPPVPSCLHACLYLLHFRALVSQVWYSGAAAGPHYFWA